MKLTKLGEAKFNQKVQKNFREVQVEGWAEPKTAWDKTCAAFDAFRVGDDVDIDLSENGKYINGVRKAGAPVPTAAGGKGWSKGGFGGAPDPERNISVYTSYVIDHMIDFKSKGLTPEQAVDQLFKVRELVKGKL